MGQLVTAKCPKCQKDMDVPDNYVGEQVKCLGCGKAFYVAGKQVSRSALPTKTKMRHKIEMCIAALFVLWLTGSLIGSFFGQPEVPRERTPPPRNANVAKSRETGYQPYQTTEPMQEPKPDNTEAIDELTGVIAELIKEGLVDRIEHGSHTIRVSPLIWSYYTLDQKRSMVLLFSRYFKLTDKMGYVDICSNVNDQKLASYGSWGGVKIIR